MQNSTVPEIAQLAELQKLDRVRKDKQDELLALEAELTLLESDLEARRAGLVAAQQSLQTADLRRRELESLLDIEGNKIKDRRMRLNRVRNEKELQALRHEIEVSREQNQILEEELLKLFEGIENLTKAVQSADEAFAATTSDATARRESGLQRLAELRIELEKAIADRQSVATLLDGTLLKRYELIFERRGGLAVVEVRNGICLGCRMSLPPQLYNELQKSLDVRLCPSCHRILVWRAADPVED